VSTAHKLADPPELDSKDYLDALREVADKGTAAPGPAVRSANRRTSEESVIGLFWAYDGASGLGTPPRLYNQIVREIATRRTPANTPAQNARLFALVDVAMADAGILAWREKYRHNLWRPVLGIREHDLSTGPDGTDQPTFDADCDCTWLPQGAPNTNVLERTPRRTSRPIPRGTPPSVRPLLQRSGRAAAQAGQPGQG